MQLALQFRHTEKHACTRKSASHSGGAELSSGWIIPITLQDGPGAGLRHLHLLSGLHVHSLCTILCPGQPFGFLLYRFRMTAQWTAFES